MQAVLFDLDGTLLDLDLDAFLRRYFRALGQPVAAIVGDDEAAGVIRAILGSTGAMSLPHPGRTNQEVFYADLLARTGLDLEEHWATFDRFYDEVFPTLGDGCLPRPGARQTVERALDLGLRVAVATNPIFPRKAIDHRVAWAGLDDLALPLVTSYEIMHACKPSPEYFEETALMLGVDPSDCMMVGDDAGLDMPASATGMSTFFVGPETAPPGHLSGTFEELADLLVALAGPA